MQQSCSALSKASLISLLVNVSMAAAASKYLPPKYLHLAGGLVDRQAFGALASSFCDASNVEPANATDIDNTAAEHVAQLLGHAVLSAEGSCLAHDSAAKVMSPCCVFYAGAQQRHYLKTRQQK